MMTDYFFRRHCDKALQIRYADSLLQQMVNDHWDLNYQWEKFLENREKTEAVNKIVKRISWLKQEIEYIKHFITTEIEGVNLIKAKEIEKDLAIKEGELKEMNLSLFVRKEI